jgi:hypothetical protein
MSLAVRRYVVSPTLSNPQYTLSLTAAMTEVDYQTRMRALLDDFDKLYEDAFEG